MSTFLRVRRACAATTLSVAIMATNLSPALAQRADEGQVDAELVGYSSRHDALPADEEWIEPAVLFDLDPEALRPLPEFDVATLHDSTIFASGVDQVPVVDDDLDLHIDRHISVLQAIDTLDHELAKSISAINIRRPRVDRLNAAIADEHREEARLAGEIVTLKLAIAELAVRAFIGEEELETAFSVPETGLGENRVVTDEVRDDQSHQIAIREAEIVRRQDRRTGLEQDLVVLREELQVLRQERSALLEHRRSATALLPQTAASYQRALHDRLPRFVAGTDIPLVALNAYVIAERLLAEEDPSCKIEWWMLAGIGKIESIHGHFADSTLNRNGHTTEIIRGPALDGRILEGAEFLVDGAVLPEAGTLTESIAVPTAGPAPDAASTGAEVDPSSAPAAPAAPVPVIKRLALITDTDGGALDRDTTYDRAVGPMQFIPQTWNRYKADANADGNSDPQNIYDAALASARYLCTATSSMATEEGRKTAFFAYNHDDEYTANVAAAGVFYRNAIQIPTEEFGGATTLGIADPDLHTSAGQAAAKVKELDDDALLNWQDQ